MYCVLIAVMSRNPSPMLCVSIPFPSRNVSLYVSTQIAAVKGRQPCIWFILIFSLISFIYVTVSELHFFQLNLHQSNQYKKKTTSFRNNPVPHHLLRDPANHKQNHQRKIHLLTYHLPGLLKLSQHLLPLSNKMTCTKSLIVPRMPPQNYHNHQRR